MNSHSGGLLPKILSPFSWVQHCVPDVTYRLLYHLPNNNTIYLAEVAPLKDLEGLHTGKYQSQFTCNVEDFKLAPVTTLQGCIIQISWYFGMIPAEVHRQFRDTRIFEPQPCPGYRDYVWRKTEGTDGFGVYEAYTLFKRMKPSLRNVDERCVESIRRREGNPFSVRGMRGRSETPGKLIALVNHHHGLFVNVDYGNVETHTLRDVELYEKFYTEHPEEIETQREPE